MTDLVLKAGVDFTDAKNQVDAFVRASKQSFSQIMAAANKPGGSMAGPGGAVAAQAAQIAKAQKTAAEQAVNAAETTFRRATFVQEQFQNRQLASAARFQSKMRAVMRDGAMGSLGDGAGNIGLQRALEQDTAKTVAALQRKQDAIRRFNANFLRDQEKAAADEMAGLQRKQNAIRTFNANFLRQQEADAAKQEAVAQRAAKAAMAGSRAVRFGGENVADTIARNTQGGTGQRESMAAFYEREAAAAERAKQREENAILRNLQTTIRAGNAKREALERLAEADRRREQAAETRAAESERREAQRATRAQSNRTIADTRAIGSAENNALGVSNRISRQLGADPSVQLALFRQLDNALNRYTETVRTYGARSLEAARASVAWNRELQSIRGVIAEKGGLLRKLDENTRTLNGSVLRLGGSFGSFQRVLLNTQVALTALTAAFGFREILQASQDLERVKNILAAVSPSATVAAENFEFLRQAGDQLGFSYLEAGRSFGQFNAAALNAGATVEQTQQMFVRLTAASRNLGLSSADTDGVIRALTQSLSKGRFSAEEIRNQLGDRLPIAMQALERATGKSGEELDRMMRDGKITTQQFAIPFIEALFQMSGGMAALERSSQSLTASLARLSNAWSDLIDRSQGLQQGLKAVVDGLTAFTRSDFAGEGLRLFGNALTVVGQGMQLATRYADEFLSPALKSLNDNFSAVTTNGIYVVAAALGGVFVKAIGLAYAAFKGLTVLLLANPIGATAAAIGVAIAAYDRYRDTVVTVMGEQVRVSDLATAAMDSVARASNEAFQSVSRWANERVDANSGLFASITNASREALRGVLSFASGAIAEWVKFSGLMADIGLNIATLARAFYSDLKQPLERAFAAISGIASDTWGVITRQFGGLTRTIGDASVVLSGAIRDRLTTVGGSVGEFFENAASRTVAFTSAALNAVSRMLEEIRSGNFLGAGVAAFEEFQNSWNSSAERWAKSRDSVEALDSVTLEIRQMMERGGSTAGREMAQAFLEGMGFLPDQIATIMNRAAANVVAAAVSARQAAVQAMDMQSADAPGAAAGRAPVQGPLTRHQRNQARVGVIDTSVTSGTIGNRPPQTDNRGAETRGNAVEEFMQDLRRQVAGAGQEGASGAIEQALNRLRDAAQGAKGSVDVLKESEEARRLVLERLGKELDLHIKQTERQTQFTNDVARAYLQGTEAGQAMEVSTRAQADAFKYAEQNSISYEEAVKRLTKAYGANEQAARNAAAGRQAARDRDDAELAALEGQLVGLNSRTRNRELAAARARINNRGASPDFIQGAEDAARALVDAREKTEQLNNSWNELSRVGEQAFDRIGEAITQSLARGEMSFKSFGNIAKAVLSEIVQAVLRLAVINPVLNTLFGGTRGTAGGVATVLGQTFGGARQGASGGILSSLTGGGSGGGGFSLSSLGSIASIGRGAQGLLNGTGLGAFFTPGAMSTGLGPISSLLNTTIGSIGGGTAGAATTSALSGLYTSTGGMLGPATPAAVAAAGYTPVTIGNVLGPAAAIGGGIYGAVSGFQRGGVGGAVQGVGGIASAVTGGAMLASMAGLLPALGALGPAGLALGAILAIGGSLLPGQRPSDNGGSANINFASGMRSSTSLRSAAAQQNAAVSMGAAGAIFDQARAISDRLGMAPAGGVAVGTTRRGTYLDIGRMSGRFANMEEANAVVPDWLFDAFQLSARDNPNTRAGKIILGSTSLDDLRQNIDFADYAESFRAGQLANNEYAQAVEALGKEIGPMVDRARRIGLSSEQFEEEYRQRITFLQKQRTAGILGLQAGLSTRAGRNDTAFLRRAAEAAQDFAELSETREVQAQLQKMGATAEDVARAMADLAEAQRRERQQAIQNRINPEAASAADSIRRFLDNMAVTPDAALSVPAAFEEAKRQFASNVTLAATGDAAGMANVVGNAQTLLGLGERMFAGGVEFTALRDSITTSLRSVPGVVQSPDVQLVVNTATMIQKFDELIAVAREQSNRIAELETRLLLNAQAEK